MVSSRIRTVVASQLTVYRKPPGSSIRRHRTLFVLFRGGQTVPTSTDRYSVHGQFDARR